MRPLVLTIGAAFFMNALLYAYIERLRNTMVTQQQYDDTLAKLGPAIGGMAASVSSLVTAVKAHPAAPDFTNELTQVQSGLDQLAGLKTTIDAAIASGAPATPDPARTDTTSAS